MLGIGAALLIGGLGLFMSVKRYTTSGARGGTISRVTLLLPLRAEPVQVRAAGIAMMALGAGLIGFALLRDPAEPT